MQRHLLPLVVTAILTLAGAAAAQEDKPSKDAAVWVIDDTDKVNPVSGNLLSEGRDIYNGKTPSSKDYRKRNNVWDAGTNTVKLFAGRNELVSFQVILEKGKDDVHKVFVDKRARHYELAHHCTEHQCHPHFTCTSCGQTHCLTEISVPMAKSPPKGFIIHRQQIRLEGLCPACS